MTYLYLAALLPLPIVFILDYREKGSLTECFIHEILAPLVLPLVMALAFAWGLSNLISQ
jgi:hypothetical protein